MDQAETCTNFVSGKVRLILQIEGLAVLCLALLAYGKFGMGWGVFAIFFLVPDISLFGYALGPKIGSALYNTAHSYLIPLLILGVSLYLKEPSLLAAGLIWTAHIGFDRMLGYGLKYEAGFGVTHLGLIGRHRKTP